jgi:hypothetical protein
MDRPSLDTLEGLRPQPDATWMGTPADDLVMTVIAVRLVDQMIAHLQIERVPALGTRVSLVDAYIERYFRSFDANSAMRETSPGDAVYHFMLKVSQVCQIPESTVSRSWRLIDEALDA